MGCSYKTVDYGDVGHGLCVYWGTWVGSGSWVWSTLKDSMRSFITFSIDKCVLCGEILRVFFGGHMLGRNILSLILIVR